MRIYKFVLCLLLCVLVIPGHYPVEGQRSGLIVFDYSHGQYSSYVEHIDQNLAANLTGMGYTVLFARGGLNSSVLTGAVGLIIGAIYGELDDFSMNEVNAISSWFNSGQKFMWVGYDSDYGGTYINDNMDLILNAVDSHVYGEPTELEDATSNCGAPYRPVATGTSVNSVVQDVVAGVDAVLMHGPTCLYGSASISPGPGVSPIELETGSITNVYPILYYSSSAQILDHDLVLPYAHSDTQIGAFVAATMEFDAGNDDSGVLVVSGASPYADYAPMYTDYYYDVPLTGHLFVKQAIDFGIQAAIAATTTTTTTAPTTTTTTPVYGPPAIANWMTLLTLGGVGIVALLGLVFILKRRKPPSGVPVTPSFPPPDVPPPTPLGEGVEVFRGCAAVGGRFEYKVKIVNNTPTVITDINVTIMSYPDECLEISGPTTMKLKRIGPGEFRSPQFIFLPTENCVEGRIRATVSYLDYQDRPQTLQVEPYMIRSVCDLLTPIEFTMEQFDQILSNMDQSSEEHTMPWNPEVLFSKVETFLPACNFHIVEASGEPIGGMFTGKIKGLAEGKHNKKKVAVRISITGLVDANESRVIIEGLGEDIAMIPTTIYEISQGIDSWTCMNCGAAFDPEHVTQLKSRIPVRCKYCEHTMTIDLYKK
ncbi:MAG: hypothetical protein RTU30_11800 [Candidatus Thorarchaeota archaeon]